MNQAELNGNPAIFHYNNPYTTPSTFYVIASNTDLSNNFGAPLDLDD